MLEGGLELARRIFPFASKEEHVRRLLQPMGDSVAARQVKAKLDVKKTPAKPPKGLKVGKKRELPDEEVMQIADNSDYLFLDDVGSLISYL